MKKNSHKGSASFFQISRRIPKRRPGVLVRRAAAPILEAEK
jgi:hypothetical protein